MSHRSYVMTSVTEQNIKSVTFLSAILLLTLTFDLIFPLKNTHNIEAEVKEVVKGGEKGKAEQEEKG